MSIQPERTSTTSPSAVGGTLTERAYAAARGDDHALELLVREGYADVWRLCSVLVDEELAEDLAQETFLRATRALRRFRGQAGARTWLFAIARNVCMDELRGRYRRRRRERQLQLSAGAAQVADPAGDVIATALLGHLEPDRRVAFVLTQLFRLSYQEAGVVCGCPTGTIRSRVARARHELIELLSVPGTGVRGDLPSGD